MFQHLVYNVWFDLDTLGKIDPSKYTVFTIIGSDALITEQPYRYLTADLMKSLRDDSLPIDVTRDDPAHRHGKVLCSTFY